MLSRVEVEGVVVVVVVVVVGRQGGGFAVLVLASASCAVGWWFSCLAVARLHFALPIPIPIPPPLVLTELCVVHRLAWIYARLGAPAFTTQLHSLYSRAALEVNSEQ
jgi:hypothetical protein